MKWKGRRLLAMALTGILLAGCGAAGQVDDYATNEGKYTGGFHQNNGN